MRNSIGPCVWLFSSLLNLGLISNAVGGGAARPQADLEQQAVAACMNAFIGKIMPDSGSRVRLAMPGQSSIFRTQPGLTRATMSLSARAGSGEELARGTCLVARDGRVHQLTVSVKDDARLAALPRSELRVAMTGSH